MNYDLIRECVNNILKDKAAQWEICQSSLKIGNTLYPLTPWRYNRQLTEMRNLTIKDKSVKSVCSYKSQRIESSDSDIYELLYEELDTCEWIMDDKIISIFADINSEKYITLILKTKRGVLCNIIISTTLPVNTKPVTKHEIVGKEGMISDRSINVQIPEEAVYLFSEEKTATYTDNDLYMLGLTPREVMVADNIIDLITNNPDIALIKETVARNEYLVSSVKKSAKKSNVVLVGDM